MAYDERAVRQFHDEIPAWLVMQQHQRVALQAVAVAERLGVAVVSQGFDAQVVFELHFHVVLFVLGQQHLPHVCAQPGVRVGRAVGQGCVARRLPVAARATRRQPHCRHGQQRQQPSCVPSGACPAACRSDGRGGNGAQVRPVGGAGLPVGGHRFARQRAEVRPFGVSGGCCSGMSCGRGCHSVRYVGFRPKGTEKSPSSLAVPFFFLSRGGFSSLLGTAFVLFVRLCRRFCVSLPPNKD